MKHAGKPHLVTLPRSPRTRKEAQHAPQLKDSNRPPDLRLVLVQGQDHLPAPSQGRRQPKLDTAHYDLGPIGFLMLDHRGRIVEFNQYAARLLALPGNWLVRCPFIVFVAKHDISRFIQCLMDSTSNVGATHIELDLLIEKRVVPVQISLTTTIDKGIVHRMGIMDLTESRMTQSQLQNSLARWHSLVQNAPDTIMTLDRFGKIIFVNRPVWGYSEDVLTGTSIFDYVPEIEITKLQRCLNEVFRSETRSECEILKVEDNRQTWFMFSFGPAKEGAATASSLSTVLIRDISEQKLGAEILRASGDQLREFAARIDTVREEERTRVARELHDELGQLLTILKLDLAWMQGKLGRSDLRKKMKAIIAHVDDTIGRVRRITSELRPFILDDLGLGPAIEWQAYEIQRRTGIRIQVISDADSARLANEASAATFRVVQEALTNVVRHAEATRVRVTMKSQEHALKISIEDNGKGITEAQITDVKSLGIVGMKERIARIGGEFNIFSEPDKGTRLDMIIPAQND
jgi:PAS domain S-box-containing protein